MSAVTTPVFAGNTRSYDAFPGLADPGLVTESADAKSANAIMPECQFDSSLDPSVLREQEKNLEQLRETKTEVDEIRAKRQDVSKMTSAEKAAALKESRK